MNKNEFQVLCSHITTDEKQKSAVIFFSELFFDEISNPALRSRFNAGVMGIFREFEQSMKNQDMPKLRLNALALGGLASWAKLLPADRRASVWKRVYCSKWRRYWAQSALFLGGFENEGNALYLTSVFMTHAQHGHPIFVDKNTDNGAWDNPTRQRFFDYWGGAADPAQEHSPHAAALDLAGTSLANTLNAIGLDDIWGAAAEETETATFSDGFSFISLGYMGGGSYGGLRPIKITYGATEWTSLLEHWRINALLSPSTPAPKQRSRAL